MAISEVSLNARHQPTGVDTAREANHRIANHLSLLNAMIQTRASALANGPSLLSREAVIAVLREISGKVVSVSHLHRTLAQQPHKSDVNICDHLVTLCTALVSSLSLQGRVGITHRLTANCNVSPEQAQQIGLMVSEIVMNAIKHAHPTGLPVQIVLACRREKDGRLTIEVADDGVGLPEDPDGKSGVGFNLIRSLANSLGADLRIESDALGLSFLITLPPSLHAVGLAEG